MQKADLQAEPENPLGFHNILLLEQGEHQTAWLAQSVERTTLRIIHGSAIVRSRVRAPHWVDIFFFRALLAIVSNPWASECSRQLSRHSFSPSQPFPLSVPFVGFVWNKINLER
jgi:hypothetical protein